MVRKKKDDSIGGFQTRIEKSAGSDVKKVFATIKDEPKKKKGNSSKQ